MLFKLSVNNIKKCLKDYTIYFFTLVIGVAVFYIFNAIESQTIMMDISENTSEMLEMMILGLSAVSVFVAIILGFLIIYATGFLMKRRKREFGLYMLLGMSKKQVSLVLLGETFLVGLFSFGIGLVLGVCMSQFMSILVAHLFEADMQQFQFVFSKTACWKTLVYFCLMYAVVIVFHTIITSRYQLIDLLQHQKKSEKVTMKNPWICSFVFLISAGILGYAYHYVSGDVANLHSSGDFYIPILLGAVSTFFIFWSLSGLLLRIVISMKGMYYRGLNSFVFRQFASKINTMIISMTVICLMLFVTICVLSSALTMNHSLNSNVKKLAPADIQFSKHRNLDESWLEQGLSRSQIKDSRIGLLEEYERDGFDLDRYLKEYVKYGIYETKDLKLKDTIDPSGDVKGYQEQYVFLQKDVEESIMTVSDYNRVAQLYGTRTYSLKEGEYMVVADFRAAIELRNQSLRNGKQIRVFGNLLKPKYDSCQKGFVEMQANYVNPGIILVPDDVVDQDSLAYENIVGNYKSSDKKKTEAALKKEAEEKTATNYILTSRLEIRESSAGIGAMVVFIGMYIGIIFLISCAAILALKELSESADNVERYDMLRKIGTDERMIAFALFKQIGIFFLFPLLLACIHSYFGIRFCNYLLETLGNQKILQAILETAGIIVLIYGGYFLVTYLCSKNMIQKK